MWSATRRLIGVQQPPIYRRVCWRGAVCLASAHSLLAACFDSPTPVVTPESVAEQSQPTPTSTLDPSPTATATPGPTTTPIGSLTPMPDPTATVTPDPMTTPIGSLTATPEPMPMATSTPRFTAVSSGWFHTCALLDDGEPVCWGAGPAEPSGRFGSIAFGQASPPEGERFTLISSGGFHTCGLREDGTAVCWGAKLGDSTKGFDQVGYGQISPPKPDSTDSYRWTA